MAANEYHGFVAVHIADKANLTVAGSLQDYDLFGRATDVAIAGNYAFVTAYDVDTVTVVDISNPHNLTVASHVLEEDLLHGAENIVIVGHFAYVTVYAADSLTILDIPDPCNMTIAGTISDLTKQEALRLSGTTRMWLATARTALLRSTSPTRAT